jgi:hypothetical protein
MRETVLFKIDTGANVTQRPVIVFCTIMVCGWATYAETESYADRWQ